MYKMYGGQWDDESDKNSLSSSFWSDGERREEEEEEEVEVERVAGGEDSKPAGDAEDSRQEASEGEKPELDNQGNVSGERSEGRSNDDDDDDDEEESSSCDSPAPSQMTSGYGTYRPEEQEGGDYRDDHTITEFDQDSRGDLSEARDDEEGDHSLCSFGGFDTESAGPDFTESRPLSAFADAEAGAAHRGDVDGADTKPEEDEDRGHLEGVHVEGGKRYERLEEAHDPKEENNEEKEDRAESEDPDESSSNKDVKFIDSRVDFSRMTYDEMCAEWEGNLRREINDAASCLEERLAELHLSASAPRGDFEAENEDAAGRSDTQSSESEGISVSAFESYMRGMTRAQSDGDIRPKPKSFIRPAMSQQTIKKTDPVAKYFQYKQLWEMFKLPGEKDRRALRWEIKERLAYQPPQPKPRRVYVPNTYIVPTEKKRSALRWEIRNDLANGLLPHKFSYRF